MRELLVESGFQVEPSQEADVTVIDNPHLRNQLRFNAVVDVEVWVIEVTLARGGRVEAEFQRDPAHPDDWELIETQLLS